MTNATSNQLQELYVAYFGRAADPAGLDYWEAAGTSQAAFASHMHAQSEFQDAFGSDSTENQVNQIYKNLFDRDADAAGLSYWTKEINLGNLKLAEIATHLIYNVRAVGGNADDLAALNNRRDAAVAYTAEVKASTTAMTSYQPLSTSPWNSGENFEEAKNYLLGIDGTTAHTAAGITASVDVIEANGTPAAKQNFALTDNVDNLTGGDGNDTFTGTKGQIDGDTYNGGRGTDTLSITVDGTYTAGGDSNASFTSSLIETIKVRATGATVLDFGDVTGVTGLTVNRTAAALTIENITDIDPITLDREDDNANIIFTYKASLVGGQSDSITLNIVNSSNAGTVTVAGIETINLVSTSNPSNDANELTLDETGTDISGVIGTEILNISGTGDLEVTDTDSLTITNSASADVEILDASAATSVTHTGTGELDVTLGVADNVTVTAADATGDLKVTAGAAGDITLTGGAGADTFEMLATLAYTDATNLDTIVGGAGTDTLKLTASTNAFLTNTGGTEGNVAVSGVEVLELVTDAASDAIDFDNFANPDEFTSVIVSSTANADNVTLTDTQASTFTVRNLGLAQLNSSTAQAGDDTQSNVNALTIDLKTSSGTADAITVNLVNRNNGVLAANNNDMTLATLTAAGVETITINTTKSTTLDSTTGAATSEDISITTLTAVDLESLTVTGDADLIISNALDDECVTINTSAATGATDLLAGTNALTYTGAAGDDTLRFASNDLSNTDTITMGAGDDAVFATLGSGTVTPTITGLETINLTFSGGSLNASSITGLTELQIAASAGSATVTKLASTATTISQKGDGAVVSISYASDTAGVTYNVEDTNSATIVNTSTTLTNVTSLTVKGDSENAADVTTDLGSLTAASLTSLTVISGDDAGDDVDTGNVSAGDLITLTTSQDAADVTVGTLASADDLTTISITGDGAGTTDIDNIGATISADALTSFVMNLSGGADADIGNVDANDADVATFDLDLTGNYATSTLGTFTADNITSFDIDTGDAGSSLVITQFDIQETLGDVTITTAQNFDITSGILAATSIGDITIVATDTFNIADDEIFIDEATTVGNISITASGDGTGVNLGQLDNTTTVGNITIVANDDVEFDGADAATTIGNINVTVAADKTADLNDTAFGAANSTIGTVTGSGAGAFNLSLGAATTIGDIDLSSMTSTSTSNIALSNTTATGITITGGAGADTFSGTGGVDTINTGLGADIITGAGGNDVIDLSESTNSVDTVIFSVTATNGNDTIVGFTAGASGDTVNLELLAGGNVAAEAAVAVNAAILDAITASILVFADGANGTGTHATNSVIADYTDVTDVAAFLNVGLTIVTSEVFAVVINDLATDKAYVYNLVNDTTTALIAATDVTLHGSMTADTADAVFTIANTVFTA